MSTTIDERIVEMKFDNKNFETNVSTTMSTLDKLKNSLKLDKAAQGLETISSSAKKVDFSHMSNGIETFNVKMKAMDVVAATIFSNLTNKAMAAATKMAHALAIEPVTTGLQEYETQIGAIQTILSNTRSAGTTIDDVNKALATLNTYADKTIYNFTEMTRNIGTFTAAGVDLQTSVDSIQGIANLAAVSGSTSQQASTAMYQLSQALSTGTVKLQDWNSVVNAGMGGKVFQDALKRTATQMGTNVDEMIKHYGSFRDSLTQGQWITTEVLTETLKQFAGAYTEADLIQQGYTKKQAKEIVELANDATNAATKVKTFTQLIDTLKEAAQSGWTQTWQIIIGDFYEARQLFTTISDGIGGIIGALSDSRNNLLTDVFTSKWKLLSDEIKEAGISEEAFQKQLGKNVKGGSKAIEKILKTEETLNNAISHGKISADDVYKTIKQLIGVTDQTEKSAKKATKVTKEMRDVVKKVINGEFGDGEQRIKALEKAGYKYKEIQELVNKSLKGEKLELEGTSKGLVDTSKLTAEQKKKLEELRKSVGDSSSELEQFIAKLNRPSGRELLFDSLFNVAKGLYSVIETVAKSFSKMFADPERGEKIYQVLVKINKATEIFKDALSFVSDSFYSVFAGLFDVLSLIAKIITGPFRIGAKVLSSVFSSISGASKNISPLNNFKNLLEGIGKALSSFAKWANKGNRIDKAINGIAAGITKVILGLRKVISDFISNPKVQSGLNWLVNKFKEFVSMGSNIIDGLIKGISSKAKSIPLLIVSICTSILDIIRDVFDIHSPAKEPERLGINIIEGLINGLKKGWKFLLEFCGEAIGKFKDTFDKIDFSTIIQGGLSVAFLTFAKRLIDVFGSLTKPIEGFGDLLSGTGKVLDKAARPIAKTIKSISKVFTGFSKVLKAYAFKMKAKALIDIAIAIAILAGSIAALTYVAHKDPKAMDKAMQVLVAIVGMLITLTLVIDKMAKSVSKITELNFNVVKLGATMFMVAAAIAVIAFAVKSLSKIDDPNKAKQGFLMVVGIVVIIGILMATLIGINSIGGGAVEIDKAGKMMLKIAIAMLIMTKVVKIAGSLSEEEAIKGTLFAIAFVAFITILSVVTTIFRGGMKELGNSILKLSIAMGILVGVCKLISALDPADMLKAAAFAAGFVIFIRTMMWATKTGDPAKMQKLSIFMIAVSSALRILASATKALGEMDGGALKQGIAGIIALSIIIGVLINVTKKSSGFLEHVAATLIALSVSLAILAGVTVILGMIDPTALAKGIIAVGFLSVFMTMMIIACRMARDIKGTLTVLVAAIAVMTASLLILSTIKTDKLIPAMAALVSVMGMFALIIFVASKLDPKALLPLIAITAMLGVAAISLGLLSRIKTDKLLTSAASLSLILITLVGALFIVSKSGDVIVKSLIVLGGLTIILGAIAYILYTLAQIPTRRMLTVAASLSLVIATLAASVAIIGLMKQDAYIALPVLFALVGATYLLGEVIKGLIKNDPTGAINAAVGLSILLATLTGCLAILGFIPAKTMYQGVTALTIMVLITGLLAVVLEKILSLDMTSNINNLIVVGTVLVTLSGICALLGLMPIPAAVAAIANLGILIGGFTAIVVALGAISKIPGFNDLLSDGGKVLRQLGEIIGGFVGSIVAGFGKAVTSALPQMGMDLSMFMMNATPFITGAKMIDKDVSTGIKTLTGAILAITASELINAVSKWILGEGSMTQFGESISQFGDIIVSFGNKVKDVKPESIKAASEAGKNLAEMMRNIPTVGGLKETIFGSTDFGSFKKNIIDYADVIIEFSNKFNDLKLNKKAMQSAVDAGMSLTELVDALPKTEGLAQTILGSKDLGAFSKSIKTFGTAIVAYGNTVFDLTDDKITSINSSVKAGEALTKLVDRLPKTEGLAQSIMGSKDLSSFGEKLIIFGRALVDYGDTVADTDTESISKSKVAVDGFVAIATTLTKANIKNFKNFGRQLYNLGDNIEEYYDLISDVDFDRINASLRSINSMIKTLSNMQEVDSSKISSFISGLSSVNSSDLSAAADTMSSLGTSITGGLSSSIASSGDAVTSSMGGVISSAAKTSKAKAAAFTSVGRTMITKMAQGIKAASKLASNATISVSTSAAKAIRRLHSMFETNGKYLGRGLVDGIAAKYDDAYRAGYKLGQKAAQGEKDGQKSGSPSKLTYQAGIWLGEGLINGIKAIGSKVYDTSKEMGSIASDRLSSALSSVTDILTDDFDMNPVITPVVDMSNVNSSSDKISRLLNGTTTFGLGGNVNAISRSLSLRQNDLPNTDVVKAINKLGTKMDGLGNVTTIGSITYDDGSNITQTVSALAKAAILEGRR